MITIAAIALQSYGAPMPPLQPTKVFFFFFRPAGVQVNINRFQEPLRLNDFIEDKPAAVTAAPPARHEAFPDALSARRLYCTFGPAQSLCLHSYFEKIYYLWRRARQLGSRAAAKAASEGVGAGGRALMCRCGR